MKIYVTRDDVHAGDDPEARTFSFPDDKSIEEIIEHIVSSGYLAQISGSKANMVGGVRIPFGRGGTAID